VKFFPTVAGGWLIVIAITLGAEAASGSSDGRGSIKSSAGQTTAEVLERYVAIDNVCAWPNLTRLRDGTITATIFNHPSHGRGEGDVECWSSQDGRFWKKRGTAAVHGSGSNRMNVAAGLAGNGDQACSCPTATS